MPSLGLGAPAAPTTGTTLGAGTSTAPPAPTPSLLRGKTLDEIVNAWSGELDERARDFGEVAGEVREWDRVLRENGEQVRRRALPLSLSVVVAPARVVHEQVS